MKSNKEGERELKRSKKDRKEGIHTMTGVQKIKRKKLEVRQNLSK